MSSEVELPGTTSDAAVSSAPGQKKKKKKKKKNSFDVLSALAGAVAGLIVAVATGLYTLAGVEKTGMYLLRNSENEFLREQRIAAYGDYTEDLLTLEEKYRTAANLLGPSGTAAQLQASESVEGTTAADKAEFLIGELEVAMNAITQAKSVVDVLGPTAVEDAGEIAIDCYGPLKGQMQYYLSEWSKSTDETGRANALAPEPTYEEALMMMQARGRVPFTNEARRSLDTPDVIGPSAEVTASMTAGSQSDPSEDTAKVCVND